MEEPLSPDTVVERPTTPDVVAGLVENHRQFLAFVERRVGSRAVAEDILQGAFVKSLDKLGEVKSDESARAWFYRTLRNAVIDHRRRSAASDRRFDGLVAQFKSEGEAEPELDRVICACVARLAETLKPEYASALRRVEVEGAALKDFAREAGITENNAAVRLFRARDALRKQVARSCGTCAEHGCLDCSCPSSPGHC